MSTAKKKAPPAAHTLGPWKAELEDRLMRDGIQISAAEQDRIAFVQPDDTLEIEGGRIIECCSARQKANAALITAAPEMYEALREWAEDPPSCAIRGDKAADAAGVFCECWACTRTRDARAAIAKAEGVDQ